MADETTDAAAADATAEPTATEAAVEDTAPVADPVMAKLKELDVDDDMVVKIKQDLGVTTVDELGLLAEKDLLSIGMKVVQARKLAGAFVPPPPAADTAALSAATAFEILPAVPDDTSWLEALRTGGVLKVDQSTVISAVRAALAERVGMFGVPDRLAERMESFAEESDEPVSEEFWRLRSLVTRRNYGDIFAAIEGLDGRYISDTRRRQLLERVNTHLWPAIGSFYNQLQSWQEAWMQGAANPAMLMATIMSAGSGGMAMPPGMLQPPDTAVLRDHADAVNDAINRVFAGTGVPVAAALAYDATQIKKTLENPRLPSMIGAASREQMLKQLGIAVSSNYPRLETNITRFVLGIMQAKNQPAGNEELQYFGALYMLGSQIPWDQLGIGGRTVSGIGGNRTRL